MEKEERKIEFDRIYIAYFAKMKRFAKEYVVSDEDAENVVHDVFLEVWEKREMLVFQINLVAYLFSSIKNKCIDCLRRRILEQEAAARMQEEYAISLRMKLNSLDGFDQHIWNENNIETVLTKAIDSLPEKCREIFIKSKIEGRKQKEIADELNVSINTIEKQMSIAYRKLKEELKDYAPLFIFLLIL